MLYDPKWERKTQANPLDLCEFIAWLEGQEPSAPYDYWDREGNCLVGQYMRHCGLDWSDPIARTSLMVAFNRIASDGGYRDYTFGGALKRARAALATNRT